MSQLAQPLEQRQCLAPIPAQLIRDFNESLSLDYIHLYGGGKGLCAELVGLIKAVIRSWQSGFRVCLGRTRRAAGINTPNGWNDFFKPVFPEVHHCLFHYLNRPQLPYCRKFPFLRPLALQALRKLTSGHRFMLDQDQLSPLHERIVLPSLGIDAAFWDGISRIANTLFLPKDEILEAVDTTTSDLGLDEPYFAVHIRRGDKITEMPYTELEAYVDILEGKMREAKALLVVSDDYTIVDAFRARFSNMHVVTPTRKHQKGYDQTSFNALRPDVRLSELKRFLVELRLMQNADCFFGSSTSNVYFFMRYMKANRNVFDANKEIGDDPFVRYVK